MHARTHARTHTRTRAVFQALATSSHPPIWIDHKLTLHDVVGHFLWTRVHTGAVVVELVTSLAGEIRMLSHMQLTTAGFESGQLAT